MLRIYIDMLKLIWYLKRGLILLKKGRVSAALNYFEKALILDNIAKNNFYYAMCLIATGKHEKAIPHLEKIVDELNDDNVVSCSLAECYMVTRYWDKAEDLLSYLVKVLPGSKIVNKLHDYCQDPVLREKYAQSREYYYISINALDSKNIDKALEYAFKSLELDEENSSCHYLVALVMINAKKPKKEIEPYLEKAVMLAPANEAFKKQLQYLKTRYKK